MFFSVSRNKRGHVKLCLTVAAESLVEAIYRTLLIVNKNLHVVIVLHIEQQISFNDYILIELLLSVVKSAGVNYSTRFHMIQI